MASDTIKFRACYMLIGEECCTGVGTIAGVAVVVIAVGLVSKWGVGKMRKRMPDGGVDERQKQRVRRRAGLRRGH